MVYKYGDFTEKQICNIKKNIQKSIFFLLLCVDRKTRDDYENIDVPSAFRDLMYRIAGMNEILLCPPELVMVESLLQRALNEYLSPRFRFKVYRKLLLDAGVEVMNIKECPDD
jgi:hypothetical protein